MFFRRIALAIGLLCGVAATQAPEFAQQYRQRLAGAIDELSRVVGVFENEAAKRSLTPSEAIARLETNSDTLARERGADMENDIDRLARMKTALSALTEPGSWRRLVVFVTDFDAATAGQAWKDFEPAVPTSLEAFAIGGLGLVFGWGATHICAWPIRRHLQRRKEQRFEVGAAY
jgi:hypothetical protein